MKVFLGIDTSNYTTSMCLMSKNGKVLADERIILKVASGSRGLRQSEALFQHVQNIPELTARVAKYLDGHEFAAIGVSDKPRPQEGSYMPVFLPGVSCAKSLGQMLKIPCYQLTHQETHIWSGIASARGPLSKKFLAIHLSGGTTELTQIWRNEKTNRFSVDLLGSSLDLHAGQFVDRLGVKIGLSFPAGPELEQLASQTAENLPVPTFHKDGMVSFSGPLSALERMLGEASPEVCARACFMSIARTLIKWIRWSEAKSEVRDLLIVGGVAANKIIRETLSAQLLNWNLYFAAPIYSVDNAYGAAFYSALSFEGGGDELIASYFS